MRRLMFSLLAAALLAPTGAHAGAFTDDLSKCLVTKSSADDETTFMQWMFSAIAAHPAVRPMSTVSDAQRTELARKAGKIMVRLLTVDCRQQTVSALKYEGGDALKDAFRPFGEVAMQSLMKDPAVAQQFKGLDESIDKARLQDLFKEAGLPAPSGQ